MPIEQVNRFLPEKLGTVDIAIGSREVPGAKRDTNGLPTFDRRGFNTRVRWLVLPGLQDTQCGFKCFRVKLQSGVFRLQTMQGMSFDAEVLYIARKTGLCHSGSGD